MGCFALRSRCPPRRANEFEAAPALLFDVRGSCSSGDQIHLVPGGGRNAAALPSILSRAYAPPVVQSELCASDFFSYISIQTPDDPASYKGLLHHKPIGPSRFYVS